MEGETATLRSPRKLGLLAAIVLLHIVAIYGLMLAFVPEFTASVQDKVLSSFTVTVTTPPPPPPPKPAPKAAGDEGAAGKKAVPKEVTLPKPKLAVATPTPAPRASSTGSAVTSGARETGDGTGGGRQGSGPGAGGAGGGSGGGAPTKPVHIGGAIDRASDFPIPPGGREARIGKSVIVKLTISPAGRAVACSVYDGSGFPESDAIVCRLAMERLRFKPATNAAGEAVTGTFFWRQRFFS